MIHLYKRLEIKIIILGSKFIFNNIYIIVINYYIKKIF